MFEMEKMFLYQKFEIERKFKFMMAVGFQDIKW